MDVGQITNGSFGVLLIRGCGFRQRDDKMLLSEQNNTSSLMQDNLHC